MRYSSLAFTLMVILSACGHSTDVTGKGNVPRKSSMVTNNPVAARLKEAEVIHLAQQVAKRKGYRLEEYRPPRVDHEVLHEAPIWVVYYQRNVQYQYPGSCFYVFIGDRAGDTRLVPCE